MNQVFVSKTIQIIKNKNKTILLYYHVRTRKLTLNNKWYVCSSVKSLSYVYFYFVWCYVRELTFSIFINGP